jgi:L-ascorbate metabolism protein UlaG (beta-lactamase superfamily)
VEFTSLQRLTNREVVLKVNGQSGASFAVAASPDLTLWSKLAAFSLGAAGTLEYTDSAAPFAPARFYQAEMLTNGAVFTGDYLVTTNGDVLIQPRYHATFVMNWQGRTVYVDPYDQATYTGLPKADLILITHNHSDHLNTGTINTVRGTNATIVAPRAVYDMLTSPQKAIACVLTNGQTTNLLGMSIEAVPAYNGNHARGAGNGYVLTIGDKRIYISGDTGDTPEMRQLTGIDVAFLSMNQPYTMTVAQATNAVTAFRPKVVYPYHYRDQSGTTTSAALFKQRLDPGLGVEVRLRKWY